MKKMVIDLEQRNLILEEKVIDLYSREAFEILSHLWLKLGWNQKHHHNYSWMGQGVIQIPEDLIRFQEVIYRIQPDVILETGVAYGGSLLFSATLCKVLDKGRVIGVDIDIRPPNRRAIEEHFLAHLITLIEGNSVDEEVIAQVKRLIAPEEKVVAILDSNHSREHVLKELEAYHELIPSGSYLIATDGFMKELSDTPRGKMEWSWDNPFEAVQAFLKNHPEFELEEALDPMTHWIGAWLKRK